MKTLSEDGYVWSGRNRCEPELTFLKHEDGAKVELRRQPNGADSRTAQTAEWRAQPNRANSERREQRTPSGWSRLPSLAMVLPRAAPLGNAVSVSRGSAVGAVRLCARFGCPRSSTFAPSKRS
jgi:hypothetical protein